MCYSKYGDDMKIKCLVVGELMANCYLLEKDGRVLIIDPGDEFKKIEKAIFGEVEEILVTHSHQDHIGALKELEAKYQIKHNVFKKETFNYEVIKTPGHTSDSLSFYFPDDHVMFTGDFLFANSIGRMDMPTGSRKDMEASLLKVSKYPLDTLICPGHYYTSRLGESLDIVKNFFI